MSFCKQIGDRGSTAKTWELRGTKLLYYLTRKKGGNERDRVCLSALVFEKRKKEKKTRGDRNKG